MSSGASALGPRRELRLWQLSIAGMLILVLACALGFAVLRSRSDFWADFAFTAYLGALLFALPVAFLANLRVRRFCLGFTLVGWGYTVLAFGPWFVSEVRPHLATTRALLAIHDRLTRDDDESVASALALNSSGTTSGGAPSAQLAGLQETRALAQQKYMLARRLAESPNDPAVLRARRDVDALDRAIQGARGNFIAGGTATPVLAKLASVQEQRDSAQKQLESVLRLTKRGTDPSVARARASLDLLEKQVYLLQSQSAGQIPPMVPIDRFVRTGHVLFGLVFALAGGVCGLAVASRRDKPRTEYSQPTEPARAGQEHTEFP